jgi:two-component system, sensor histidine kinase
VLETAREGETLVLTVRDTGIGIPPEMLPHVFEMFAQADRSLERTTSGLGVGLSLSRRLIELHGGRLEAKSAGPGLGSEFTVRIPANGAPTDDTAGARTGPRLVLSPGSPRASLSEGETLSPAASGSGKCCRVLVVDDNEDFADTLGRMLKSLGHEVRVEHDGLAGLAAARTFRPDIAFLDIGMPGLNGYDLARRLRAFPSTHGIVLIAVTGWGQANDRQRAHDAGFDEHPAGPRLVLVSHRRKG